MWMTIINSLMVGVSFRATSDFFICMIKEKKEKIKIISPSFTHIDSIVFAYLVKFFHCGFWGRMFTLFFHIDYVLFVDNTGRIFEFVIKLYHKNAIISTCNLTNIEFLFIIKYKFSIGIERGVLWHKY